MGSRGHVPLSASRVKLLKECSWKYWCRYHLHLPDPSNDGAKRGTVCHLIFEVLGNPRHKKHFQSIIRKQDVFASPAVARLVKKKSKEEGVDDSENLDLIYQMILEGLNHDFYALSFGKPTASYSEEDFDIEVYEDGKDYRMRGFLDKLFLFKKKKKAVIRDFKTSKSVYSGKEVDDNIQHRFYSLAVKHQYPEYEEHHMEFVFVKFSADVDGVLVMPPIDKYELEGWEYELTAIQERVNNFSEEDAYSSFAFYQGFPKDEDGFTGRLLCGFAKYKGQLKVDGTIMWHCPFKFPFDYYVALDEDGRVVSSVFCNEKSKIKELKKEYKLEKRHYAGCPVFNEAEEDDPFI